MEKIVFYIKNNLKDNIELSKIGVIIRKLNDAEYSNLLNGFKNIILEGNDLQLAKDYSNYKKKSETFTEHQKVSLFEKISKSEKENLIINIYNGLNKNIFDILNLKNIIAKLNNFLIVEIDKKEFNKHFFDNYIYDLIPKIVNFTNYISSDGDYKKCKKTNMYEYKSIKEDKDFIYVLFTILLKEDNNCYLNEKKLRMLEKMFKIKDREFNFSFIMMIDNLLEDNTLVENSIINKVSFLERMLISKEENKCDAFVLKVGILCNTLFEISNETLSKRLKEIYNIRSMLVHGDGNKIIDNIDYYKTVFSNVLKKGESKLETKLEILWCVDAILDLFLIRVLNKYLQEPNLCEFIKQN